MATNEEILDFKVAVDIRDSLREIEKFNREMVSAMKAIAKSSEDMGKTAEKAADKATKATKEQNKAVDDLADAYDEEANAVSNLEKTILEFQQQAMRADGERKKSILENIKLLKQQAKERKKAGGGGGSGKKQDPYELGASSAKEFRDRMKKAGEELKAPLQSFLSRDAKGLAGGVGTLMGKAISKTVGKRLQKRMEGWGGGLQMKGQKMSAKSIAGGGKGRMGKMLGGLGKTIASIGPALSMIGGAFMGLLKLFIDADSMVKEFNKGILDSASTAGFLNRQVMGLDQTLKGVRDSAMDASFNLDWGISKDQHTAMFNVLTQEGVALDTLARRAGNTREGMAKLSQEIVSTGVAYSRALGVPISEIGQLQGQMMTEMGMSVKNTSLAFATLTREANDSGIAANRFFQMIKTVSHDMSVWNMRMEDSTKLLGKLGKVLSPKTAEKFFNELSSGFKNMGRDDLLKRGMFAGGKAVKQANQGTLDRMNAEIAKSLGMDTEKVAKMSRKEIQAAIQKSGMTRDQTNVAMERLRDRTTVSQSMKGGTYAQSQALRHTDTAGQMTIIKAAFKNFGADIKNANAMSTSRVAEALGISMEMAENFAHMARTAEDQKSIMLDEAKRKGDQEEIARIMAMSEDELVNELGKQLPKSPEEINKEIRDQAMKQGQMTQSITDKLGVLVDWFMNKFYNLMMDVFSAISKIANHAFFGGSSESVRQGAFKQVARDSDNKGVARAMRESGGDRYKFRGHMMKGAFGKDLAGLLREGFKEGADVTTRADTSFLIDAIDRRAAMTFSEDGKTKENEATRMKRIKAAAGAVLGKDGTGGLMKALQGGQSLREAMNTAGLSKDQRKGITHQLTGQLDPESVMHLANVFDLGGKSSTIPAAMKAGGGAAAPPAPEAVEEQAEIAQTSDDRLATIETESDKQTREAKKQTRIAEKAPQEISKGNLESMRQALYEYYLYKDLDKSLVTKALGGGNLNAGLDRLGRSTSKGWSAEKTLTHAGAENKATSMTPNSSGGLVTGISNGMAVVAAQGEGQASVGKGERIVPAGGGGGTNITIPVNGVGGHELARVIEGKVVEGIREYKRREKLN